MDEIKRCCAPSIEMLIEIKRAIIITNPISPRATVSINDVPVTEAVLGHTVSLGIDLDRSAPLTYYND